MRTAAKVAIGLTGALAAAYVAERLVVSRLRRRAGLEGLAHDWRPAGEEFTVAARDGARLAVVTAGDGPTVVLSHGVMLSMAIWPLVFDPLVAAGFRVVAYDQRGHGRSTVGETGFAAANLGRDLADVLTSVEAGRAVVVGHSMGGIAILTLLAEHPEWRDRLAGMVLVGTTPATFPIPALLANAAASVAGRGLTGRALASPLHGTALARVGFGPGAPGAAIEAARRILAGTDAVTIARANRALVGVDHTSLLPQLDLPAVVVCGDHDRVVPPGSRRRFAEGLPRARMVDVPAGHMLPLEAPEVVVAETVALAGEVGLR